MGTHPIFESDFDCLTEQMFGLNLRRLSTSFSSLATRRRRQRANKLLGKTGGAVVNQDAAVAPISASVTAKGTVGTAKSKVQAKIAEDKRFRSTLKFYRGFGPNSFGIVMDSNGNEIPIFKRSFRYPTDKYKFACLAEQEVEFSIGLNNKQRTKDKKGNEPKSNLIALKITGVGEKGKLIEEKANPWFRECSILQRRFIGFVQGGQIVQGQPQTTLEAPYQVDSSLIEPNDPIIDMPNMEMGKFADGTKVSFFVAVSRDEETRSMKMARQIEQYHEPESEKQWETIF